MNPDIENPAGFALPQPVNPPEEVVDYDSLIIEDNEPVDGIFTEKQMRLLTAPLYVSWDGGGHPFLALANVGLFPAPKALSLCPDVMVSRRVRAADNLHIRKNNSYFVWVMGKVPEVVVEIISDKKGGEEDHKMVRYAEMKIPHYVLFDPENILEKGVLRVFRLVGDEYQPADPAWLEELELGVCLWEGTFEDHDNTWLRWCDRDGNVIPTGAERAEEEKDRADKEQERAQKEKDRAKKEKERAKKEKERAEKEKERADQERQAKEEAARKAEEAQRKAERLAERLRSLGVNPDE